MQYWNKAANGSSQFFSDFDKQIITIDALNNESEKAPNISTPVFTAFVHIKPIFSGCKGFGDADSFHEKGGGNELSSIQK